MDKKTQSQEIDAPKGYVSPDHEGEDWDQVCTMCAGSEGKLRIKKVGEHGYDEQTEAKANRPDYKDMSTSVVNYMKGEQD